MSFVPAGSGSVGLKAFFASIIPIPPAAIVVFANPKSILPAREEYAVKVPVVEGRPYSFVKPVAHNGPWVMISRGVANPGFCPTPYGSSKRLSDTINVAVPWAVLPPNPTAHSSRISPPAPVAAPGKAEMVVG